MEWVRSRGGGKVVGEVVRAGTYVLVKVSCAGAVEA